jgi:hypothetical protein
MRSLNGCTAHLRPRSHMSDGSESSTSNLITAPSRTWMRATKLLPHAEDVSAPFTHVAACVTRSLAPRTFPLSGGVGVFAGAYRSHNATGEKTDQSECRGRRRCPIRKPGLAVTACPPYPAVIAPAAGGQGGSGQRPASTVLGGFGRGGCGPSGRALWAVPQAPRGLG